MATVLEIGEAIADRCRLQTPTSLFANTGMTERQILRAIKDGASKDAYLDVDWTILSRTHEWTTDASSDYALPTDYGRYISGTGWDDSNFRRVIGPVNADDWQTYKTGLVSPVGINKAIRIAGTSATVVKRLMVYPVTDTGTDLLFEYISSKYVLATDGTTKKAAITADTDTFMIPEEVVEVASVVRMKRMLGLGYAEEAEEYEALRQEFSSNDANVGDLHMDRTWWRNQFLVANIPDTGYAGV